MTGRSRSWCGPPVGGDSGTKRKMGMENRTVQIAQPSAITRKGSPFSKDSPKKSKEVATTTRIMAIMPPR